MAKEDLDLDVEAGGGEAKKGGGLKWVIIGVVAVLVLGGATFAALYFAGVIGGEPEVAEATSDQPGDKAAKGAAATKAPPIYMPMEPPFVVNFGSDADVRFMQITLQISARDQTVIDQAKEHSPAIRNSLVLLFSSQDPQVLNTREGKEALRKQALDEINKVLKEQAGVANVDNVFFTSFVMQ